MVALSGCERDGLLSDPAHKDNLKLDAGARADTGVRPVPVDAGVRRDAGPPDAGPSCPCPPLPSSCTLPAADRVAFTDEGDGVARQLLDLLACAEQTFEVAIYETDWTCPVDAIAARLAQSPNLRVSLVIDDDACPRIGGRPACPIGALYSHPRVTIVDDMRSRYMHHKFAIADGRHMWVASANWTVNAFCSEVNDGLVLDRPEIVAGYRAEFSRMFDARQFGPVPPATPARAGPYTVYFAPTSPADAPSPWFTEMVRAIRTASTSVDFMIAAWTRAEVSEALIAAQARGVRVRGLVAPEYKNDPAAVMVINANVPLRSANVHDKLAIIDGRLVITGSPNWSENSWGNNEASLWIRSSSIAAPYVRAFERVYAAGTRL